MNDTIGDIMKSYEKDWQEVLPSNSYVIIRIDGKAFHTFCDGLKKPFSNTLSEVMQNTTIALCEIIQNVRIGYTQSDEISLLMTDFGEHTQQWFGGKLQKIVSVAASTATSVFNSSGEFFKLAQFDARVFTLPDKETVGEYFIWRQRDATKNAISAAAQAHFSHKELQGLHSEQLIRKLEGKGIVFGDYPEVFKKGAWVIPVEEMIRGKYLDKRTNEVVEYEALRNKFKSLPAPQFETCSDNDLMLRIP